MFILSSLPTLSISNEWVAEYIVIDMRVWLITSTNIGTIYFWGQCFFDFRLDWFHYFFGFISLSGFVVDKLDLSLDRAQHTQTKLIIMDFASSHLTLSKTTHTISLWHNLENLTESISASTAPFDIHTSLTTPARKLWSPNSSIFKSEIKSSAVCLFTLSQVDFCPRIALFFSF